MEPTTNKTNSDVVETTDNPPSVTKEAEFDYDDYFLSDEKSRKPKGKKIKKMRATYDR